MLCSTQLTQLKVESWLDIYPISIIIKSLVQMKNKLTQQGRFTDCLDDLLMKVIAAPMKRY